MKGLKIALILLAIITLTGCTMPTQKKEKTPHQIICENMAQSVEEYKADQMTFEEISIIAEVNYDQYCEGQTIENTSICLALYSIVKQQNDKYEIKDCNQYKEGVFKDACEAGNKVAEDLINNRERMEKIYVENLETHCLNVEEEE